MTETKKIEAYRKIHKLFIPYIKRITGNIIDRINYFLIIKKYLMSIKETNNCLRLYNINTNINKITYRIGKNIILDKRIGSDSVYGIVFLSHFKTNIKYGNKFDKLNKFAVKITDQSIRNKNEIKILELLTNMVINFKCPHFPISYGSFKCDNNNLSSGNTDDYSIVKDKKNNKSLFPELINKNKSILIQLNELASGDLEHYLIIIKNTDKLNDICQILLSIMFFHYYTKNYHTDAHDRNFLYHKIKPGGYFHYNIYGIDYYLENKGYLWVIWDFGRVEPYDKSSNSVNWDFITILYNINNINNYMNIYTTHEYNTINILFQYLRNKYDNITDHKYLYDINSYILNYLVSNVLSFTLIKPENIINKNPYIIKMPEKYP